MESNKIYELQDIPLEQIYDFIENGVREEAPPEIVDYLEAMDKVRGMALRLDKWASKDAIINHLIKIDGLSRYLASKLYDQTMEYFYADSRISKAAWRNIYAEQMQKVIAFAIATMENASDASKVVKMILEMGKMRQLDEPDKDELPEELFARPYKMYSLDAEYLGLPTIDRRKLAQKIDSWEELSEPEKEILKREAQILPLNVFPDDDENPRKG